MPEEINVSIMRDVLVGNEMNAFERTITNKRIHVSLHENHGVRMQKSYERSAFNEQPVYLTEGI